MGGMTRRPGPSRQHQVFHLHFRVAMLLRDALRVVQAPPAIYGQAIQLHLDPPVTSTAFPIG
jgi:hypothetical protein